MTDRCVPITFTAPDGTQAVARVHGSAGMTDDDRAALSEIAAAAARHFASVPHWPHCEHLSTAHDPNGCVVRVRRNGHGHRCGCTTTQETP